MCTYRRWIWQGFKHQTVQQQEDPELTRVLKNRKQQSSLELETTKHGRKQSLLNMQTIFSLIEDSTGLTFHHA